MNNEPTNADVLKTLIEGFRAVDEKFQNAGQRVEATADHHRKVGNFTSALLGNFTSALLGNFETALTPMGIPAFARLSMHYRIRSTKRMRRYSMATKIRYEN